MSERSSSPVLSSLGDFFRAGLRPRTPLAKTIVVMLCVKLVIVIMMRVFLFSGEARPPVDAQTMIRIIGPAPR